MKKTYAERKAEAQTQAIEYQLTFAEHNYYMSELAYYNDYFTKQGKRYGLLREFRENGII